MAPDTAFDCDGSKDRVAGVEPFPQRAGLARVQAQELAIEAGEPRAANVVMLGVYNTLTSFFDPACLDKVLRRSFPNEKILEFNLRALEAGRQFALQNLM